MTRTTRITLASMALFSLMSSTGLAATKYLATDFGAGVIPAAINTNGDIVGTVVNAEGGPQAFLKKAGETTTLGTLGGTASWGTAINDAADITGVVCTGTWCMENPYWGLDKHIFVMRQGLIKDLSSTGILDAAGINNSGFILGRTHSSGPGWELQRVLLYDSDSGAITDVNQGDKSDANLYPIAVNNLGHVVYLASYFSDVGNEDCYLYRDGNLLFLGRWEARDMNDSSVIVGAQGFYRTGVIYSDELTSIPDVHSLKFVPVAIANDGSIIGDAVTAEKELRVFPKWSKRKPQEYESFPAVYSDRKITPLQDLLNGKEDQWVIQEVLDVNDKGQIIGYGTKNGEPEHGILLTPVKPAKVDLR